MFPASKKIKSYFPKQKLWGLIAYRPSWGLTLKGWLSTIFILIAIATSILLNIHPFLSPSAPIAAEVLIVEGWISDDGIKGAIAEFERGNYQLLITVGIPIPRGVYLSKYKDFSSLSAATAIQLGFDSSKLVAIPTPPTKRDRTLASGVTVKQWLEKNYPQITRVNLYSYNVHGRRSWLLFKRALNPKIEVGIIAHPTVDYNPESWWTYSDGFREVISEAIAYIYAKFLS